MGKPNDEMLLLVCMRATAPFTVPGSDFSRHCRDCGTRIMIAPSGQETLKRFPKARLVCVSCIRGKLPPDAVVALPMDLDATYEEMQRAVPNLWRERN